jgi:hypothetical protein
MEPAIGPEEHARRFLLVTLVAGILVGGIAFSAATLVRGRSAPSLQRLSPGSITRFNLDGRPIRRVAVGAGAAWFIVQEGESGGLVLVRIDAETGRVSTIRSLRSPQYVVADARRVWVVSACYTVSNGRCGGGLVVFEVDPATGQRRREIPIGPGQATALGGGASGVWIVVERDPTTYLVRIDPRSGRVEAEIRLPRCCGLDVAVGDEAVWVPGEIKAVFRIDPTTNEVVATIRTTTDSLTTGAGRLWLNTARSGPAPFIEVDSSSNQIVQKVQGPGYGHPVVFGGRVWLARFTADRIVIQSLAPGGVGFERFPIAPRAGRTRFGSIGFGGVAILGIGEGAIWTGTDESGQIIRIQLDQKETAGS